MLFAAVPAGFVDEAVAGGISNPTAMEFAPDGRIFVTRQTGQLVVVKDGSLLSTPFLSLTVDSAGERGLLGVAFDPNFSANRYLYVYYTVPGSPSHNRVSRFTASTTNGDVAQAGSEVPILDLENLSTTATNHNGGAIHFGADGKLYVAVGENATPSNAQTLSNRLGKVLRINPDGSIPADNPFYNTASGANRAIWALGLRNPYTFAVQPGTGTIYINDVGNSTWEEVNVGAAGANYGWSTIEGVRTTQTPPTLGTYTDPRHAYRHPTAGADPTTVGIAISGGTFYNPATPNFPVDYTGDYFFADYGSGTSGGNWIRKLEAGTGNSTLFATALSSPVDLKTGPDGKLYYLERGNTGRVRRIAASVPAVESVQVDSDAAQRSMIRALTVTFTRGVTLDANAFKLEGRGGAGAGVAVGFAAVAGSNTAFRLTFSGTGVVGGSLPDGVYDLTVQAGSVHDAAVPAQTMNADNVRAFHRLYGDDDGDGDVDAADLFQLRKTVNKSSTDMGFIGHFDYDASGVIDAADLFQIRKRARIEFKGY